jgi:hypothetical protein
MPIDFLCSNLRIERCTLSGAISDPQDSVRFPALGACFVYERAPCEKKRSNEIDNFEIQCQSIFYVPIYEFNVAPLENNNKQIH